jgi:hypothetical protein
VFRNMILSDPIIFWASCIIWISGIRLKKFKNTQTPPPICTPGNRKLVLMDASGWYSPYYMGFMEFILETYGREPFKDIMFAGISGGGHAAGYSISTVHGPSHKNIRYWLERGQKFAVGINKHICGYLTEGGYLAGVTYYNTCDDDGIVHHIADKYFSVATNLFGELVTCDSPKTADEFGRVVGSTSNVPIIGSFFPVLFRGIYLWDGLCAWLYSGDKYRTDVASLYSDRSTLIFTMMSESKFISRPNVYVINMRKTSIDYIPKSLYQTMKPSFTNQSNAGKFCDTWFDCGYNSAKQNHACYQYKIERFLTT